MTTLLNAASDAELGALLGDVVPRSPFYRRRYAGLELGRAGAGRRLRELPYLEAGDLLAHADELRPEREPIFRVTCSGGTVDAPKVLYRTAADWARSVRNVAEIFRLTGVAPGDVLLCAQPFGIWGIGHLALEACRELGCTAVPAGIHDDPELTAYYLRRFGVNAVFASPSLWKGFTAWAEGRGVNRDVRVLVAGEKLYDADRDYLSGSWGRGVYNVYGSEETDGLGAECDAHDGVHVLGHSFLFELAGAAGGPAPARGPAEGELIVTSYYHRGTPLIRYRLGDIVTADPRPCACGNPQPRLRLVGKTNLCVTLYDATKLYAYQVDRALEGVLHRSVRYQLRVEAPEGGTGPERVTLVVSEQDAARAGPGALVEALCRSSLDFADSVRNRQVEVRLDTAGGAAETTAKGKWKTIIDHRRSEAS